MNKGRTKKTGISVVDYINKTLAENKRLKGVLLCEGKRNSLDIAVYKVVYKYMLVLPLEGCENVQKELPRIRQYVKYPVFAIIDRDNRPKRLIRQLCKQGIYVTKLPFIENIVCCPEVLKIICKKYGYNYPKIINRVKRSLTAALAERLSLLNPFNVEIPKDSAVEGITMVIYSDKNTIKKSIDLNNVMYTYRGKIILSEVSAAMGHSEKRWYSGFIIKELDGELKNKLRAAMSNYLPKINNV